MNATDIIGWAYEADIHCLDCTARRFAHWETHDREGNELHPVFACEEDADALFCGDCGEKLI